MAWKNTWKNMYGDVQVTVRATDHNEDKVVFTFNCNISPEINDYDKLEIISDIAHHSALLRNYYHAEIIDIKETEEETKKLQQDLNWYKMWHNQFKKEIEELTTELETYRPTKLQGNGQCKCYRCKIIHWTDWCSKYKGHVYCDNCLNEILTNKELEE